MFGNQFISNPGKSEWKEEVKKRYQNEIKIKEKSTKHRKREKGWGQGRKIHEEKKMWKSGVRSCGKEGSEQEVVQKGDWKWEENKREIKKSKW